MAEHPEQAPAGWYADPHAPHRMRYFDGQAWTNHFHEPGKLPGIGEWFNTMFSVIVSYWQGALVVAFGTTLVGNMVFWIGARSIIGDLAVVDEELVGVTSTTIIVFILLVVFALLWQGFGWLAVNRYMHRAHFRANPTVGDSLAHAVKRLPTYVRIMIGLVLVFVLAMFVIIALAVAVPVLGILVILALIPVGIWLAVKLSFLPSAIAAAPSGTPMLRASADVSTGQFWPVLGRVLILSLGLGFATQMLVTGLGEFGSPIDPDAFADLFLVNGDQLDVDNFRFSELVPSAGKLAIVMVLTSIIQGASALVSTSGYMRLYLDSGAPSDLQQAGESQTV